MLMRKSEALVGVRDENNRKSRSRDRYRRRGDVCRCSTHLDTGGNQFGTLQAHWGYGTAHDGERYELHLCEDCFFQTLTYLKQERRTQ